MTTLEEAAFVIIPDWITPAEINSIRVECAGIDWWISSHAILALRGYDANDPLYSADPEEMDPEWQALNPDRMGATLTDTKAYGAFPVTRTVVDRIPGDKDRVRFMGLSKGEKIIPHTDPLKAGLADGELIRLHIPIDTNDTVLFHSEDQTIHFPEAALCYFDMRKTHSVENEGTLRLHLVVDVEANQALRDLLTANIKDTP
jgi:hypothetical protein